MSSSASDDEASTPRTRTGDRARDSSSATLTATSSILASSASNVIGANVSANAAAANKQKSLFAGMGRVRHINHLREKWSGKPKTIVPPTRTSDGSTAVPMSPSSTAIALRKVKKLHTSNKIPVGSESESDRETLDYDARRRRTLSAMDMERYRTLFSWLEQNGIELPQHHHHTYRKQSRTLSGAATSTLSASATALVAAALPSPTGRADLFDDVYNSLEMLERAVESEISQLPTARMSPPKAVERREDNTNAVLDDNSAAARTTRAPPLVDYLVVIGPDVADVAMQNYWRSEVSTFEATVAFAWPPESQFNAESIEHFCFPSGVAAAATRNTLDLLHRDRTVAAAATTASGDDDNFFVLVLSGGGAQGQSVQYASCMKGLITLPGMGDGRLSSTTVPVCYCLISELPFIPFFKELLTRLLDDHRRDLELEKDLSAMSSVLSNRHAHKIDDVLWRLKRVSLPAKGTAVSVQLLSPHEPPMQLYRPREEGGADEKNTLLLQWSLPHLLLRLSIEQVLRIVEFLLLEMKVVVVSKSLTLLSSATLGIASLLHPLKWAGPLITVLPPFLHEYLEAPVPLICGVDHLSSRFEYSRGTVVVDLEHENVVVHDDDRRMLATQSLAGFGQLAQSLSSLSALVRGDRDAPPTFAKTHFAVDVMIRRVRRHIARLLDDCMSTSDAAHSTSDSARWKRRVDSSERDGDVPLRMFTQSQMFQKYQDDQLGATPAADETDDSAGHSTHSSAPASSETSRVQLPRVCDWREAASVLFHIALTGASTGDDTDALDSNNANEPTARHESDDALASASPEPSDRDQDTEPTPALSVRAVHRTTSSQSLWSTSSRRTDRDLDSHRHSPPSSPVLELPDASGLDDFALASAEPSRMRSSRARDFGLSQSYSPATSVSDDHFGSPDSSPSPVSGVFRSRNAADFASFDALGIAISPRRGDTETTISVLGTTFVHEEPTDSPVDESGASWFSDASSADGKDTDSNDQDSPTFRTGFQYGTAVVAAAVAAENERRSLDSELTAHRIKLVTRTSSSRTIQRSWRQWKAKQQQQQQAKTQPLSGKSSAPPRRPSGSGATHSVCQEPSEQSAVLVAGVWMQKRSKRGEWSDCRVSLAPDLASLSWESYVNGKRYLLSTLALADLTQAIFQATGLDEPQAGEYATIELVCETKRSCFRYALALESMRFVSTLYALLRSVAVIVRESSVAPLSLHPDSPPPPPQQIETRASELTRLSDAKALTRRSSASHAPSFTTSDVEKFKVRLQEGFVVEKHGRVGKPHVRLLFTDVLCSRIMWKKPSDAVRGNSDDTRKSLVGRRRTSSSFFQKCVLLSATTSVVEGKHTRVFKRSSARLSDDALCISIVTPTRTLDFRALSPDDFHALVHGLRSLVRERSDSHQSSA